MAGYPVRQALRPRGFNIGVIGRPQTSRQRSAPCAPRPSWGRQHPRCGPHSRQTDAHRQGDVGASPATACLPIACKVRNTGCSRIHRGEPRDTLPTAATASRPCAATRHAHTPSPAGEQRRALSPEEYGNRRCSRSASDRSAGRGQLKPSTSARRK